MPDPPTPIPYKEGVKLRLQVLRSCCHDGELSLFQSEPVVAVISKTFDITMSPVMVVTLNPDSGPPVRAVLKLYDRRFGVDLRNVRGKYSPHTAVDEEALASFVQQGKIERFLGELEEEKTTALIALSAWHFLDEETDGVAKYEAALWQECNEAFECETEAYSRLQDLQGISIPRLYAQVALVPPTDADAAQRDMAPYTRVKGVLLQYVPGYNLWDLPVSSAAPTDAARWPGIIQRAVDVVHDINARGILLDDCAPRNVVVDESSQKTFIIDFAQSRFKDKMILQWQESEESDPGENQGEEGDIDEDWDPEVEYWERVRSCDNPGAIGAVMATRLLRAKGMTLTIKYPDCSKIIQDIKCRKPNSPS